jgi:proteasome lid subunit RPN8/RPN11
MRIVELPQKLLRQIEDHGRAAYPNECCGFLLGGVPEPEGPTRRILEVRPARNEFEGEQRRRFVIPPEELRTLERQLEGSDRGVVGYYHSHPDHPAQPSEFDRDHAWPWYTYLITRVSATEQSPTEAFELDPDRREFDCVDLRLRLSDTDDKVSQTLRATGAP